MDDFGTDPDYLENYGWREYYHPLTNLHLSTSLVDPTQLIGHTVKVTLINNIVQEVEYIGSLTDLSDTGSGINGYLLRAARSIIGNLVPLNDENAEHRVLGVAPNKWSFDGMPSK